MRLLRAWATGPLVLVGEDVGSGVRLAYADLPIAEARAREPLAGTRPATATIGAAPGWQVGGRVQVWPTASRDLFVRADVEAPPGAYRASRSRTDLLWHVVQGRCNLPDAAMVQRTREEEAPAAQL